ncbi:MAG: DUF3466 family protein [Thermoguttaceae bacterium]
MKRWITGFVVLSLVAVENACGSVEYTVTDLGNLPDGMASIAYGINNNGQVAGDAQTSKSLQQAFLYSGGAMQSLGTLPGGNQSWAYGINNNGQVVGYSFVDPYSSNPHAFIYSNGAMQDLGTLPGGSSSWAYGINNKGQVVGNSYSNPRNTDAGLSEGPFAFLYSNGVMQDLGTLPGGSSSYAYGINNKGQVTGWSETYGPNGENTAAHAFLYSGGVMQDLGTLGGQSSFATGINDDGNVVGGAYTSGNATFQAFLYSNGVMQDLGTLGGPDSNSQGINNRGQVVGYADTSISDIYGNFVSHAFLYSGGSMLDLNSLIPSNSGWTLVEATDINDNGQICGYGINSSGQTDAFLLTPTVPEPSALIVWSLIGSLGIALGWRRKRKRAA